MSIEELFKGVIAALEANTAAVNLLEASLVGRASSKPKAELAKEEKPKTEAKVEVKEENIDIRDIANDPALQRQLIDEQEPDAKPEVSKSDVAIPENPTSYETLRELVLKLAGSGKRAEIQAVSKKHGLNAPKDLLKDAADMSSVTDQAKLEAVYADLLALEA